MEQKTYKGTDYPVRPWTKEEIRKLIAIWPTLDSLEKICNELKRPYHSVNFIRVILAKEGVKLEKKPPSGWGISKMIREVIEGK